MSTGVTRLMNSIKIIYLCSSYYNTPQRLSALLFKITNQMVGTCKKYVMDNTPKIWDIEHGVLSARIERCKQVNQEYQNQYRNLKEALNQRQDVEPLDLRWLLIEGWIWIIENSICGGKCFFNCKI